jgi:hypothetical protein
MARFTSPLPFPVRDLGRLEIRGRVDGIDVGKKVPIKVRVIVKGDEMTVDLTDVSRQVRGFYNSGITTGFACSQVAYKCLTSPTDYPINDGSFRSLKTIVPPGRIISAVRPAPMRWWMTYPMTIVDTVFKALAPVIPDRTIAGHHADLLIAALHGINTKTSEFFLANFGPLDDQLLAGALMKIVGMAVAMTAFGVSFYRWYQASRVSGSSRLRRTSPSAGRIRPSILRRYSHTVFGRALPTASM